MTRLPLKRSVLKRCALPSLWIVTAVLLLWRFGVVAERSERSVHWRPPVASSTGAPALGGSGGEPTSSTGAIEELERRIFELSNRQRQRHGLTPLDDDLVLAAVARRHSEDMLRREFFDHVTPEGVTPAQRIAASHRSLVGVTGENVWSGSGYGTEAPGELARTIVEGWMESRGHRENILRPSYTHPGVGIAADGGALRAPQSFAGVRAYLRTPLPERVRPEDGLELATIPYGEGHAPAELFSLASGDDGVEPRPIAGARADTVAGVYSLRLYFPEASDGNYSVHFGPSIVVE